jgi:ferredoxin like protein
MIVDEIFDLVSFKIHPDAHIRVKKETCQACPHKGCTFSCPARCYQWNQERNTVDFAYEACLECGTCLIICDQGALDWNYPKGGFGVRFRLT